MVDEPESITIDETKEAKKELPDMKDWFDLEELIEYSEFNQNRMTSITGIVKYKDYIFSMSILNDHKENKVQIHLESQDFRYIHVDDRVENAPPSKYGEQKNSAFFNFDFETPWSHIQEKIILQVTQDKAIIDPLVEHAKEVQDDYRERIKAEQEKNREELERKFTFVKRKVIQTGGYWKCKKCGFEYLMDKALTHQPNLCKRLKLRRGMTDKLSIRHMIPEIEDQEKKLREDTEKAKKEKATKKNIPPKPKTEK